MVRQAMNSKRTVLPEEVSDASQAYEEPTGLRSLRKGEAGEVVAPRPGDEDRPSPLTKAERGRMLELWNIKGTRDYTKDEQAELDRLEYAVANRGAAIEAKPLFNTCHMNPHDIIATLIKANACGMADEVKTALREVNKEHEGSFIRYESHPDYFPLIRKALAHPEAPEWLKAAAPLTIKAYSPEWLEEGKVLLRGPALPNVTSLKDIFTKIEPLALDRVYQRNAPKDPEFVIDTLFEKEPVTIQLTLSTKIDGRMGSFKVEPTEDLKEWLSTRSFVPGNSLYFEVEGGTLSLQYSQIIGSKALAFLGKEELSALANQWDALYGEKYGRGKVQEGSTQDAEVAQGGLRRSGVNVVISEEVAEVLGAAKGEGNILKLQGQLDRKLYGAVDEVLNHLGGKWDRSKRGHVFPEGTDALAVVGEALEEGSVVNQQKKWQFFETPTLLAIRMVGACPLRPGMEVLEPSFGAGAIASVLPDTVKPTYCEADPEKFEGMNALAAERGARVVEGDFLAWNPGPVFDAVVANPPFSNGQDLKHVIHMLECLKPGGTLATVMTPFEEKTDKATQAFKTYLNENCIAVTVQDLPEGAFKDSGTNVRTCLLFARKMTV